MAKNKSNKVLNFSDYTWKKNTKDSRKISKKSGRTNNKLGVLFILLVIVGLICVCLFTPVFNIEKIEVRGTNVAYVSEELNVDESLAENEVLEDQENQCTYMNLDDTSYYTADEIIEFSKIKMGNNIFKENLRKAAENICTAPYVKNVNITRKFPNELMIEVEERNIFAFVDYVGSYICIDDTGYVMNSINKKEKMTDQPIIEGILPMDIVDGYKVGEILDADDPIKLQRALSALDLLEKNELLVNVVGVDVSNKDEVLVLINNGDISINFGNMTNMNMIIQFLPKILEDVQGKKGKIIMNSEDSKFKPRFFEDV